MTAKRTAKRKTQAHALVLELRRHERREFRRDEAREAREIERQARMFAAIENFRHLVLAAIDQRTRLEATVDDVVGALNDHAVRIDGVVPGTARRVKER